MKASQGIRDASWGTSIREDLWRVAAASPDKVTSIAKTCLESFQKIKNDPSAFSKALSITRNIVILFDFGYLSKFAACCGHSEAAIDLFQSLTPVLQLFKKRGLDFVTGENIAWSAVNLANAAAWAQDTKLSFFGRFEGTDTLIKFGALFGFAFLGVNTASQPVTKENSVSNSAQLVYCIAEVALLLLPVSGSVRVVGVIFSKSAALVSFMYRPENNNTKMG